MNGFLIDSEAATHSQVLKTVQRFTLAGDFHVDDQTERTVCLSVQGAGAAAVISSVLGAEAASLERFHVLTTVWRDQLVTVIRATHTGEDGFDLFMEAGAAPAMWEALTTWPGRPARGGVRDSTEGSLSREEHGRDARATVVPFGFDALEFLRVEAGIPRFGIDMDETNVVSETGLDEAISFTKGCYIGQEIIARIKYRGHVAKKLSGLLFAGSVADGLERDAKVKATDGKEIGRITSFIESPRLERTIALGYVKYDYLAAGTEVRVSSGAEDLPAKVTELPLVRGSWWNL
jgi:folate-binding protein YgfZ